MLKIPKPLGAAPLGSKLNHNGDSFTLSEHDSCFYHNPALHGGAIDGRIEHVSPASATRKATMSQDATSVANQ